MKKALSLTSIFVALGCAHKGIHQMPRHSFEIPSPGWSVIQHERDHQKRIDNSLYLPNRRVQAHEFSGKALADFVSAMYAMMQKTSGIGIAANQVGKNIQIFMLEAKPNNPRYQVLGPVPFAVFINPRIVKVSPERKNFWHACLSAVGEKRGNVATYEWIEIEATDPQGNQIHTRLDGLAAVIFQHEFRHMLGGTYLDRATTFLTKEEFDRGLERSEIPFFEPTDDQLPLLIGDYHIGDSLEEHYTRQQSL